MIKKVLVIEDSTTMRSLIATTIDDMDGLESIEACNGFNALKILPSEKISLIITDINMPDINGLEIVNFVKKNPLYKDIPIIIVTSEQSDNDRKKGLSLGASEYITKPFDPDNLREVINKVMEKYAR